MFTRKHGLNLLETFPGPGPGAGQKRPGGARSQVLDRGGVWGKWSYPSAYSIPCTAATILQDFQSFFSNFTNVGKIKINYRYFTVKYLVNLR